MASFPVASLSCPAVRQCVGVGTHVTSLIVRQVGNRFTEQLAPVPSGYGSKQRYAELSSVSCSSVAHCDAVGQFGALALDEVWSDGVWTAKVIARGKEPKDSEFTPDSVSCPSTGHCMTSGLLFTDYDPDEGWTDVQEVYAVK